jgi:hypothetical protein
MIAQGRLLRDFTENWEMVMSLQYMGMNTFSDWQLGVT